MTLGLAWDWDWDLYLGRVRKFFHSAWMWFRAYKSRYTYRH